MIKKLLITGIEPWAVENPKNIRTASLSVKVNNGKTLNAFVPNWDYLNFEGMSLDEIKALLVGKTIKAELQLYVLNLKKISNPKITPNVTQTGSTTKLIGRIINLIGPFFYKLDGKSTKFKYFYSDLDCGGTIINVQLSESEIKKYNLKVGDYIEAEGRLDIKLKKILNDKEMEKDKKNEKH
jgi:hypothetical protein